MYAIPISPPSLRLPNRPPFRSRNTLLVGKIVLSAKQGGENEEKSVDESMVVLKMRIKKMKVLESTKSDIIEGDEPVSSDWKEWEKKLFTHYHEDVYGAMEMLQTYLMNTRPSVAVGMMALLAMSVPLSSSVVMGNLVKVLRAVLAGCHICIDIDF